MTWLLDTNVFINAAQKYYGLDFCPGFWQWLQQNLDCLHSIDMVKSELVAKDDDLSAWCNEHLPSEFFCEVDDEVHRCYDEVVKYVLSLPEVPFNQHKKDDFFRGADPMLVAYAMKHGDTLVTNEKYNPAAHKKIYLPNIANHFGVACTDIFEVMRQLQAKLVLE